ncbi:MAG: shikimate dehydrogenase [Firmicutes bacterium]|nr:shikimate dehydrogenase [Bacillota bacterium]
MPEELEHFISGETRLCGLIGNPVGHTLSPLIHNTLAELTGTDLVYVPLRVEDEGSLGEAIRGAYELNILGMNVTVPYKSAVIPFLRDIDPSAEKIGAVNTLVRVDGGYKGYNTDCSGIGSALKENGVCFPADQQCDRKNLIRTDTVVMIGAGGAAKAACCMCGEKGVRRLIIVNRTVEHAARLAETVQKDFPAMSVSAMPLSEVSKIGESGFLAIQCTRAGLTPKVNETPVADRAFFQKAAAVYDVIYNPEETLFLRLARQEGTPGWCGLDMLLQQGIRAFTLWTGIAPGETQVKKVRERLWTTLY